MFHICKSLTIDGEIFIGQGTDTNDVSHENSIPLGIEESLQHHIGQMLSLHVQVMFGTNRAHHKLCLIKLIHK